jgi:SAM-dependent methyltransferase
MSSKESDQAPSKVGLYATLGLGCVAIGFSIATIPFLTPALRKHTLPYIPATPKQIKNVFKSIKLYSNNKNLTNTLPTKANSPKLVDLGSGDGRIVFEAAKRGYEATGVELNAVLVLYSKFFTFKNWTNKSKNEEIILRRPSFKRADFWKVNMSEYDIIVVFGVQEMMTSLASKLKSEIKPNTLIVSCRNPIPNFTSVFNIDDEIDSVWIYDKESLAKHTESEKTKMGEKKQDDDDDDD